MQKFLFPIFFPLLLLSCTQTPNQAPNNPAPPTPEAREVAQLQQVKLDFNQPVQINKSVYVLYPLVLNNQQDRGSLNDYSGSSTTTYWNIVFYNTLNGQYHLLDEQKKMLIHSYSPIQSGDYASTDILDIPNESNQVGRFLYYTVTTLDFNNDGKLKENDPQYLFISDKTGRNFRQVSPDSAHVLSWQPIPESNKILLQVKRDNNQDKKFNEQDETVPMVYDLNTGGLSKEVFTSDFNLKLKRQLDTQWGKEQ